MNQTTPFWGFIAYLLSFLGCGGGDYYDNSYPTPIYPDEKVTATKEVDPNVLYDASLIVWDVQKEDHNNSYEYSLSFSSIEGRFGKKSTFTVKEGVITKHDFLSFRFKDNGERNIEESWTEEKDNIGSHKEGFPAKTLDEIYKECGNTYLAVTPSKNDIFFEAEHVGIISLCGYVPYDCVDDCFEGFSLESFKWLD